MAFTPGLPALCTLHCWSLSLEHSFCVVVCKSIGMTVSYSAEAANAGVATFGRLLFRWKASVYKLIYLELAIYLALFFLIAVIYQFVLDCDQQKMFNALAEYCNTRYTSLPLTFVMGFYVNLVVNRWWEIFMNIAWPDRACYYVSMCLPHNDRMSAQCRRAIARYMNLAQLIVLREVSTAVKARYATMDRVIADGFMTQQERYVFQKLKGDNQLERHSRYWLVMQWALDVLCRANDANLIRDQFAFAKTFDQIVAYRDLMGNLLSYDWVCIPLSYTQVVTLVVYCYFISALIGHQYTEKRECHTNSTMPAYDTSLIPTRVIEKYLPIFPVLEFVFLMGWLKVAESIMNPLGQDDDDFEINYIIDRNLAVSYGIVDSYRLSCPQVKKEKEPLPAITNLMSKSHRGSAAGYHPMATAEKRIMVHRRPRGGLIIESPSCEEGMIKEVKIVPSDGKNLKGIGISPPNQILLKKSTSSSDGSTLTSKLEQSSSAVSKDEAQAGSKSKQPAPVQMKK